MSGDLFSDPFFLGAVVVFLLAVAGLFWIIRALRDHEPDIAPFESFPGTQFSMPTFSAPMTPPSTPPMQPPPVRHAPEPTVSLESLAEQLSELQAAVQALSKEVKSPAAEVAEMKQAIRNLETKSGNGGAPGASAEELKEISAKVDRVYKILSTFSGPEPR